MPSSIAGGNLSRLLYPPNASEAIAIQHELKSQLVLHNAFGKLNTIAGIDVGYDPENNMSHAIAVVMKWDELKPLAVVRAQQATPFPYIPGLLSFREAPAMLEALRNLPQQPDIIMVDSQGIAHPRRLGIAAHIGVLMDVPTLGVAKSRLTGTHDKLPEEANAQVPLMDKGERIGTVLRSKKHCLPLYISPGHRIDIDTATALTQHCLKGYRLPEPTRIADKLSKKGQREFQTVFV